MNTRNTLCRIRPGTTRSWLIGLTASLALSVSALAQTPSFNLIGYIEAFALKDSADPMSEATMTVRGIPVTLPRNLLVTLPGQYLTAQDIFRGPNGGPVQASSGLALTDPVPPRVPFEADLMGNMVDGAYVAGVARISQGPLHVGTGFIQAINMATGELRVGALGGALGARVRLNDPKGIYGLRNNEGGKAALPLDARFALDPDNSPVHARTGYPVCVARSANDELCPAGNRPAAPNDKRFTCGQVAAEPLAPALGTCDPKLPARLKEGDHVAYVGMLVADPAGGFVVAAHGLEAELGIYTSPKAEPVYVYIEMALQGTLGERFPDIPQEETTRVKIVGFTTDPTRAVEVRLIDTGRNEVGTPLTGPAGLIPSSGPQLGRFRNTWPAKDDARAIRRDILAQVIDPRPRVKLANGLTSGQYVAPIGEYISPEATRFGVRGFQPPVPFENFCFLAKGGGTFTTASGVQTVNRLSPFPDSGHAQAQAVGSGNATACDPPQ
jgi:hypothetical protein